MNVVSEFPRSVRLIDNLARERVEERVKRWIHGSLVLLARDTPLMAWDTVGDPSLQRGPAAGDRS